MTPEQHLRHLGEFIRGVELSGGTTPHVGMTVAQMDTISDPLEKLWFAGCYALTYNWPTAERIWLEWRPHEVNIPDFYFWAEHNWAGLPLRKERKTVFRKEFFADCATSYTAFAQWLVTQDSWPGNYGDAFTMFTSHCRYMGRYIAIRWLEVMRRAFGTGWSMPDVRADGGEHPRKTLALLYPEHSEALLGGNSAAELRVTDADAERCMEDLSVVYGVETNYYELQSLLCEYKQSVLGRKQYPGKSIDTEMDYARRVAAHWGEQGSSFLQVRSIFPDWSRGELAGWAGVRKELGSVLVDHGYTWSDAVYDYSATTDLANPVRRPGAEDLL